MTPFFSYRTSTRIFIAILAINLPLVSLAYVLVAGQIAENIRSGYENSVRSHSRLVADTIGVAASMTEARDILEDQTLGSEVVYAALIASDGEEAIELSPVLPNDYVFREDFAFDEHEDGVYGISIPVMVSFSNQQAYLRLSYDESVASGQIANMYKWGLYAAGGYMVALVPISLLVAVYLTSPVRKLRQAARRIADGNLKTSLNLKSSNVEVNDLTRDLENMRVELIRRGDEIAGREARYRAVVQNAAEGFLTLDQQGYIEDINDAALGIFGYTADEVIGTPFTRFLIAADTDRCVDPNTGPNIGKGMKFTALRKNHETLPVLVSTSKVEAGECPLYSVVVQDISERAMFEEKLERLAYYDSLTGLPNRRLFHDRLGQALHSAERHEKLVAVLFLDLDRFKSINDTLGHMFGDLLLQATTRRMLETVRAEDTLARLGGDEFSIILTNIANIQDATRVAEKIIAQFEHPFQLGEHEIFTSTSIGITIYPFDDSDIDSLIKNADTAMYQAKSKGRNTYELYTASMHAGAMESLGIENALRKAVQQDSLRLVYQPQVLLHYQPQIDHFSGQIVGAEALVRWQHPELGLIAPDRFIPIAEETGLIIPIGEWILRTACEQNKAWQDAGLPPMVIAVNLSARQLQHPGIVEQIEKILEETGLAPHYLELELTESMILHNLKEVGGILQQLKNMGVKLSIDDFGTGQSSLANVQQLSVDKLKIDKSFIHNITSNESDATIAIAVIEMAHKLGLQVVAEGVEMEDQLLFLHSHHCDVMQGFFFSRPVPAEDLEILLISDVKAQNPLLSK